MTISSAKKELILVGGGLANGLIAYLLNLKRPDLDFILIERGDALGGRHTWSFCQTSREFSSTLNQPKDSWMAPLLSYSWDGYSVKFPKFSRKLNQSYHTILSHDFDRKLRESLGKRLLLNTHVAKISEGKVYLNNGAILKAPMIIDGRGWQHHGENDLGYQKFCGLVLKLAHPHGLAAPLIMDANIAQKDGFRFFYCLPYSATEILIEDTYYSRYRDLDLADLSSGILKYAAGRGWQVEAILSQESGCLPIPLLNFKPRDQLNSTVLHSGMRANLFHYTTGYSIIDSVHFAEAISSVDFSIPTKARIFLKQWVDTHHQRSKFFLRLNNMMFGAAKDDKRRNIFARFYRLPAPLIQRFYAGNLNFLDKLRLLIGKPPVPLLKGIFYFFTTPRRPSYDHATSVISS